MKNQKLLESFVAYCKANPGCRFWQALRSWAEVDFILTHKGTMEPDLEEQIFLGELVDTFYFEEKDK